MTRIHSLVRRGLLVAASLSVTGVLVHGQEQAAGVPLTASRVDAGPPPVAAPSEHPLAPSVAWAKQTLQNLDQIKDYSCRMTKRERINGKLGQYEYLFVKVRHEPFSVYTYFMGPKDVKGQEALYIEGRNGGNLLAHPTGLKQRIVGTVSLHPTSSLAMEGNRYPITDMGMKRLVEKLVEFGESDMNYDECEVTTTPEVKVDGRPTTMVEVVHPHKRPHFRYHISRIYIDDELNLPVRFEAYGWPAREGAEPPLVEEYTYTHIKLNQGLSDLDFSTKNSSYGFE